jgi:hypothetical protein
MVVKKFVWWMKQEKLLGDFETKKKMEKKKEDFVKIEMYFEKDFEKQNEKDQKKKKKKKKED